MKKLAQLLVAGSLAAAMWAQGTPTTGTAPDNGSVTTKNKSKMKKHHAKRAHHQGQASGATQTR